MDLSPGTIIGGCRIESEIGRGGMGTVYKAHHLSLDIPVALKLLQPLAGLADSRERFQREARMVARLNHPTIVRIYAIGREGDFDYIVMEYVEGESLGALLKRTGTVGPERAMVIVSQVLEALNEAYKNGIVHRDIKPDNILIEKSGKVKVADLGLARSAADLTLTQTSTLLGSPFYVAPEQANNPASADTRSDIYSLGCTLYHMLGGNAPYTGNSSIEIVLKHLNNPVPDLRLVNSAVPSALAAIAARMMAKEPSRRYQTPREALEALEEVMRARGRTEPIRTLGQDRRRHARLALGIVSTCLVLCGAGILLYAIVKKPQSVSPVAAASAPALSPPAMPAADTLKKASTPAKDTATRRDPFKRPRRMTVTAKEPEPPANDKATPNPLLPSVKIGDTESLRRLLEQGVSPNSPVSAPTTPLHEAVRRGSTEQTELLLSKGANPNVRDRGGDAPLHYALRENATFLTELLLRYGADPNLPDRGGKTPLRIASTISSELERMLREKGAH